MATRAQIRDALKVRLQTISGLEVYDVVPDNVAVPCATVGPPGRGEVRRADLTFAGGSMWLFAIRVYVSRSDGRSAQDQLDPYLDETGSKSVQAAIYADQDLADLIDYTHVVEVRDEGVYTVAGVELYGAEILVEAAAS